PRKPAGKRDLPFVTWDYQDEALLTLHANLGIKDVGIEKARDMGASWMCLLLLLHAWQYQPASSFMIVSRNETFVDAPGDSDCLAFRFPWLPVGVTSCPPLASNQSRQAKRYSPGIKRLRRARLPRKAERSA